MTSSNLFLKTFDPILMNGFKNKKELENYWLLSELGCVCLSLGVFSFIMEKVLFDKTFVFSLTALLFITLFSFFLLGIIFSIPFLINAFFIKMIPNNLTYMYVKYMWQNSKGAILVGVEKLPDTILSEKERSKLLKSTDEKQNIQMLIKAWHKTFTKTAYNTLR